MSPCRLPCGPFLAGAFRFRMLPLGSARIVPPWPFRLRPRVYIYGSFLGVIVVQSGGRAIHPGPDLPAVWLRQDAGRKVPGTTGVHPWSFWTLLKLVRPSMQPSSGGIIFVPLYNFRVALSWRGFRTFVAIVRQRSVDPTVVTFVGIGGIQVE